MQVNFLKQVSKGMTIQFVQIYHTYVIQWNKVDSQSNEKIIDVFSLEM